MMKKGCRSTGIRDYASHMVLNYAFGFLNSPIERTMAGEWKEEFYMTMVTSRG